MATLRVGYCAGAAGRPGLSLAKLRLELGYATLAADPAGARVFDGRGFGASPCLPLLFEPLELCGVSRQLLLSLLFKEILPELAQPYDHVVWQSPDWVRRGAVPIDVCDLFQVHGAED